MALQPVYSTILGAAIAHAAEEAYGIGRVTDCTLVQRGFNDVYLLRCDDGDRIGRLSGHRARGPANIEYETAFLAHLKRTGVPVGAAIAGKDGRHWRVFETPEGGRTFALFERLSGHPPIQSFMLTGELTQAAERDLRLVGAGHARIHAAGTSYAGPPSLYRLDSEHLLSRPLAWLLATPTVDDALRFEWAQIGSALTSRLAEREASLSEVSCHGDNHGGNTLVSDGPMGERIAAWFDFDDSGPGFLAYDLAVLLWDLLCRTRSPTLDKSGLTAWSAFVEGYREVRPIPDHDFEAISLFVSIRSIWFLGECASRISQWGTQPVSSEVLRWELALIRSWADLVTPAT
jgi:Ser/Thr protein kinase RdoA (MazF antagonist)